MFCNVIIHINYIYYIFQNVKKNRLLTKNENIERIFFFIMYLRIILFFFMEWLWLVFEPYQHTYRITSIQESRLLVKKILASFFHGFASFFHHFTSFASYFGHLHHFFAIFACMTSQINIVFGE